MILLQKICKCIFVFFRSNDMQDYEESLLQKRTFEENIEYDMKPIYEPPFVVNELI
jgi:hypothetical protein